MGIRIFEAEEFIDYLISLPHFIDKVWYDEVIVFCFSEKQRTGNESLFKLEQRHCVPGSHDTGTHH